mgnify:CR=1 FL=1
MFERRLYHHIDWALVMAMLALCGLGELTIYSSTLGMAPAAAGFVDGFRP